MRTAWPSLARLEQALGGTVVRATVFNRGADAVRLTCAIFEVATGLTPSAPARFFKHGYQSWSASGGGDVGASRIHRRDSASFITRVNHQSEDYSSSRIPRSADLGAFHDRGKQFVRPSAVLAGFIGAATSLSTLTVASPEKIIARAILDDVTLAPGAHREIDPLFVAAAEESAARLAARWADAAGRWMNART